MLTLVTLIHWVSGFIIVAEALNKLERTAPCRKGLTDKQRITESLKALAWGILAVGGAGAFVSPIFGMQPPTFQDMCVTLGFALLIVRTRVKENFETPTMTHNAEIGQNDTRTQA